MDGSRVSLAVGGLPPPLTRYRAKPDCARLPNEPDCRIGHMSGGGSLPRWGTIGHMVPLRVQKLVVLSEVIAGGRGRTNFWMSYTTHQVL